MKKIDDHRVALLQNKISMLRNENRTLLEISQMLQAIMTFVLDSRKQTH